MAARRMGFLLILLSLCICLLPCSVLAVSTADRTEPISTEKKCQLALSYHYEGDAFEDVSVKLYQVANVSAEAEYALTKPFQTAGLELNGIQNAEEWDTVRYTLESKILTNNIDADSAACTNQDGQVVFDGLAPGLYLAKSESVALDGQKYAFQSALIALPGLQDDGSWQYTVTAAPKAQKGTTADKELKVLKLWEDEDGQSNRPESIEVEIYCDGKIQDVVTLDENNNWSYTWKVPADGGEWMVGERHVPDGYTPRLECHDGTFVLVNTATSGVIEREDGPGTGDTQPLFFYAMLLFVSGSALMLLGAVRKRETR